MSRLTMAALAILLYANLLFLQGRLDYLREAPAVRENAPVIFPKPELVGPLALGHTNLLADYYWLKTIQYLGACIQDRVSPIQIWKYAEFVTELAPKFLEAYYYPAVTMISFRISPEENVALLEKGRRNLPASKDLAFLLGFVYYYFGQNSERAAVNLDDAARLSGYAPYAILAARIRSEGGDLGISQSILAELDRDPHTRAWGPQIQQMMKGMEQKTQLDFLNRKLEEYRAKFGSSPKQLEDLAGSGLITAGELPKEPFGGKYYLDAQSHQARSTKPYYLGVYRPKDFAQ